MDPGEEHDIIHRNAQKWDSQYLSQEGRVWGDESSPTVNYILSSKEFKDLESKSGKLKIPDFGAGYGRDTMKFAEKRHFVVAFELAKNALHSASARLKRYIPFNIQWINGNFLSYTKFNKNEFDVIYSHRTLHLLTGETLIQKFKSKISRIIKNEGLICISARDLRDFDPSQMAWIDYDKKIARYTLPGRQDHVISFWSKERFEMEFGDEFIITSFVESEEIESIKNPQSKSRFLIMLAVKKNKN